MADVGRSVLSGAAPLTRTSMSGGIELNANQAMKQQRFGTLSRTERWGRRNIPIERVYEKYHGSHSPVGSLDQQFTEYFKFVKQARKEDLKHQGRAGIYGMFKNFTDMKLWKKLFGTAKDPTVAALHQIRDILIEEFEIGAAGKGETRTYRGRQDLDPVDFWTGIFALGQKSFKGGGGIGQKASRFGGQIFGAGRSAFKEEMDRPDLMNLQGGRGFFGDTSLQKEMKKAFGKKDSSSINRIAEATEKTAKRLAPNEDLGMSLRRGDEALEEIKIGDKKERKKEKKVKKGMDMLGIATLLGLGGAAIGNMIGGLFGGKGAFWGGLAGFIIPVLPFLVPSILSIGFSIVMTMSGWLFSFAKWGLTKALPMLLKFGLPASIAAGMFAKDIMGEGGAAEQWKAGNKGEALLTAFFGKKAETGDIAGALGNTMTQVIKYASIGFMIGTATTGVGGPVGAVIGAVIGALGGGWKSGLFKSIYEKWTDKDITRMEYTPYFKEDIKEKRKDDILSEIHETNKKIIENNDPTFRGKQYQIDKNRGRGYFRGKGRSIENDIIYMQRNIQFLKEEGVLSDEKGFKSQNIRDLYKGLLDADYDQLHVQSGQGGLKEAQSKFKQMYGVDLDKKYIAQREGVQGSEYDVILDREMMIKIMKKQEDTLEGIKKASEETAKNTKGSGEGKIMWGKQTIYENKIEDPKDKK